jgi:phospholipase C
LSDRFDVPMKGEPHYGLSVYGPNGFFRAFEGSGADGAAALEVETVYDVVRSSEWVIRCGITLAVRNAGAAAGEVKVRNGYTQKTETVHVPPAQVVKRQWRLEESFGWYDLLVEVDGDVRFRRHIAGHVETGRDSVTDPAMGKV